MSERLGAAIEVKTSDQRTLGVEVSGAPDGWPVFLLHGTPGSRTGPRPRASVLYRLGVRLITYDRPGYGLSSRDPGRTVSSAASDVARVAEELGIKTFSVVGRSGGGPHALACAALLPQVARAAVLVSLAPADATGLNWFEGMTDDNIAAYRSADASPATLVERLRLRAARISDDPRRLFNSLHTQMMESDRRFVRDAGVQDELTGSYREAFRSGANGWVDDVLAFRGPWGFDLRSTAVPVRLWHGEDDNFAPATHTKWLASQIPFAQVEVQAGSAHFGAMEFLPTMLGWLAACRDQPTERVARVGALAV